MTEIGKDFLQAGSLYSAQKAVDAAERAKGALKSDKKLEKTSDTSTVSTRSADKVPSKLEKAASDFEALLLHQMLKSMWQTVPEPEMLGTGQESQMYRDLFNEALSESISQGQGIGIKEVIARDLERLEGEAAKK